MKMLKNEVKGIKLSCTPIVKVRVIEESDSIQTKEEKKKFPYKLHNDVIVTIETSHFSFSFKIKAKYIWNGADIPKYLWWIGSSKDNDFLIASMIHDYMLEFKYFIYKGVLKKSVTIEEYRRLTSLIFREVLKDSDVGVVKSNIMSWFVQTFQATINRKAWSV